MAVTTTRICLSMSPLFPQLCAVASERVLPWRSHLVFKRFESKRAERTRIRKWSKSMTAWRESLTPEEKETLSSYLSEKQMKHWEQMDPLERDKESGNRGRISPEQVENLIEGKRQRFGRPTSTYAIEITRRGHQRRREEETNIRRLHPELYPFECSVCSWRTDSNSSLKRHVNTVHEKRGVICGGCSLYYSRKDMAKVHQSKEGSECRSAPILNAPMQKATAQWFCVGCERLFNSTDALREHREAIEAESACRNAKPFYVSPKGKILSGDIKRDVRRLHTCEVCGDSFSSHRNLLGHKTTHRGRMHICAGCGKTYASRYAATRHQKAVGTSRTCPSAAIFWVPAPKDYTQNLCLGCGRAFASSDDVEKHKFQNTPPVCQDAGVHIIPPISQPFTEE
ncbi:hypothetical protein BT69DRAFT_1285497 [Atractiella rhizophila]|nr:hypothetical protein BT69DRAFT_1285497 [Atractiella rhizophila]